MGDLSITLTTASALGLIFVWLSMRVINARVSGQVLIGDAGNTDLQFRIRAHANFCEYLPIFLILLGLLEFMGGNRIALMVLAALFVLARLLHVPGMAATANLTLRQAGILGSFAGIVAASLYGLYLGLV